MTLMTDFLLLFFFFASEAKFSSQNRSSPSGYNVESEGPTHHPSLQDSSVTLDTPARYEIRYETLEDKRHGYDASGMLGLPQGMPMPSAALKPFPNILPQSSMANQNGPLNPGEYYDLWDSVLCPIRYFFLYSTVPHHISLILYFMSV